MSGNWNKFQNLLTLSKMLLNFFEDILKFKNKSVRTSLEIEIRNTQCRFTMHIVTKIHVALASPT